MRVDLKPQVTVALTRRLFIISFLYSPLYGANGINWFRGFQNKSLPLKKMSIIVLTSYFFAERNKFVPLFLYSVRISFDGDWIYRKCHILNCFPLSKHLPLRPTCLEHLSLLGFNFRRNSFNKIILIGITGYECNDFELHKIHCSIS